MKLRPILLLAVSLLPLLSCQSEVREAIFNQDKYIDDFISKNYADSTVYRNGGVARIVLVDTLRGAPAVEAGDSVYLFYAGHLFGQQGPGALFVRDSGMVRIGSGDLIKGLEKGLLGARLGEESLIVFSADNGYGNQAVGLVPENTALLFNVGVAWIKKNQ